VPELVVLNHTAGAGPSAFVEVLDARSGIAPWRAVDVPAGDALPEDPEGLAGLVIMGGRMSAVDPAQHAWMPPELDLIRRAVDAEVPVLGVCLGAQLLGQAFGGEVARREVPEVGFLPLVRTDEGRNDPVVAGWPDHAVALFVHEDEVVALPPDARPVLDGSDGSAAWRLGSALAVQFHPEVTAEQLAAWIDAGLLDDLLGRAGTDVEALVEEARRRDRFTVPLGRALIGRFLDGPVRIRVS
jgi:GMP synthase (glutamine-hydrolysing)